MSNTVFRYRPWVGTILFFFYIFVGMFLYLTGGLLTLRIFKDRHPYKDVAEACQYANYDPRDYKDCLRNEEERQVIGSIGVVTFWPLFATYLVSEHTVENLS